MRAQNTDVLFLNQGEPSDLERRLQDLSLQRGHTFASAGHATSFKGLQLTTTSPVIKRIIR